jgi:hypothetical protein
MNESKDIITVHVNIDITTVSLEAIVENAKKFVGKNEKGIYRIDTADKVSEMISNFLRENHFEEYAKDIINYPQ